MIIAISGTAGSGKSTAARELARRLGYRHYSMGDFQRELAAERGITIEELGELEKKDKSIDLMVDEKQRRLGDTQEDFVIDSWLSACFLPQAFKVFLTADLSVRARRIMGREPAKYRTLAEAERLIQQREETNRVRWKAYYSFDFLDRKNYDLWLDSTKLTPKGILDAILAALPEKPRR